MAEAAFAPPDKIHTGVMLFNRCSYDQVQLPLQLEDDDVPDFPRGGGTSRTRKERNKAREEVEKDFERDIRVLKKRKKEKRAHNRNNSTKDDPGLLFGRKLLRCANKITSKVDKERKRVSLGAMNSYIVGEEGSTKPSRQSIGVTVSMNGSLATPKQSLSQSRSEDLENGSDVDRIPLLADAESRALVPPLEVQLDDIESLDIQGDASESVVDVTDDNEEINNKKARVERELEIRAAEERLLEKDIPRSADEFEKLIRSSPNSSFVWIKYMAFMLSLADIERARSIAERALRTINIREESEKLNIWVAYFNLENEYGNPPEEAVQKIFQRALLYCDPKKANLALLGMYERTEQHKLADDLLNKMSRKLKHSCKVWVRKIQSLVKRNSDGVESVVERGLKSLPRHKHIKFITQTAILEFKCGVPDRGRSLFERMLREYPKRTDLWSVYLDQEIRVGDADLIRALFERAISLSLPPKKMKFLFNRYLQYEKSTGEEQRLESVKAKAMEYVATLH
ncbi:rRNA biogenesis protein rrp5 [Salvia divinorum]|uniref:rRNA biogenesis protein rrp5 n=1 Tax=Salvia divinorum TaxID=28513 RepID=A0ABD1GGZ6_SALDI